MMPALATRPKARTANTGDCKHRRHMFDKTDVNVDRPTTDVPTKKIKANQHDPHIDDEEMHGVEFTPGKKRRRNWAGLFKGTREF